MQKYSQVEFNQISIGCNLLNFSSILHKAFFWSWIDRKSWKNVASFSVVFSNDKGLSKLLLLFTSKVCFMFYAVILKQIQYFITTTIFSVAWLIDINENANCSTKPQCGNLCFFCHLDFTWNQFFPVESVAKIAIFEIMIILWFCTWFHVKSEEKE